MMKTNTALTLDLTEKTMIKVNHEKEVDLRKDQEVEKLQFYLTPQAPLSKCSKYRFKKLLTIINCLCNNNSSYQLSEDVEDRLKSKALSKVVCLISIM